MTTLTIDTAAQANLLANQFYSCSAAVDAFRLNCNPPLPADQMAQLKLKADALSDQAYAFTADAIGATLATIQPDLDKIRTVTGQAADQLNHLNEVSEVITMATAVFDLGVAIASGNPGSILGAGETLAQLVAAV